MRDAGDEMGAHLRCFRFAMHVAKQQITGEQRGSQHDTQNRAVQHARHRRRNGEAAGRPLHVKIDKTIAERHGARSGRHAKRDARGDDSVGTTRP